ncbi:MAG: asparagine synthase-related protein, partial [Dietzia sp.]|nr:asparagine synthase-related protein [Dietzia sp.]
SPYDARHPLFTRAVFEYLWRVPSQEKILPRCDRYLQRRALKCVVPDEVRRRIGGGGGTRAFVEGLQRSPDWREYLCDSPKIAEIGIADAARWQTAITQASVGQTGGDAHLTRGIAVEVWLKQSAELKPRLGIYG